MQYIVIAIDREREQFCNSSSRIGNGADKRMQLVQIVCKLCKLYAACVIHMQLMSIACKLCQSYATYVFLLQTLVQSLSKLCKPCANRMYVLCKSYVHSS